MTTDTSFHDDTADQRSSVDAVGRLLQRDDRWLHIRAADLDAVAPQPGSELRVVVHGVDLAGLAVGIVVRRMFASRVEQGDRP